MDCVILEEARKAGLTVSAKDGRLVVRGPKCMGGQAQALLAQKDEVLAALASEEKTPTEGDLVEWIVWFFVERARTDLDGILTDASGRRWPIRATIRSLVERWEDIQGNRVRWEQWFAELREFYAVCNGAAVRWEERDYLHKEKVAIQSPHGERHRDIT